MLISLTPLIQSTSFLYARHLCQAPWRLQRWTKMVSAQTPSSYWKTELPITVFPPFDRAMKFNIAFIILSLYPVSLLELITCSVNILWMMVFFLLWTALVRYNSCFIKFTHFKGTMEWFLVNLPSCCHSCHNPVLECFHHFVSWNSRLVHFFLPLSCKCWLSIHSVPDPGGAGDISVSRVGEVLPVSSCAGGETYSKQGDTLLYVK